MPTMYARLDRQGTAIGESALCATCRQNPEHQAFADAPDSVGEHSDCSRNDALACVICGTSAPLAAYEALVCSLFENNPERVMDAYGDLYSGTHSWQAPNAQERFEACLEMDGRDGDGAWVFQRGFDAFWSRAVQDDSAPA